MIKDHRSTINPSHDYLVVMTDTFLSGWGEAANLPSFAAWSCNYSQLRDLMHIVEARTDSSRVRVVHLEGYRPNAHLSVYDGDVALERGGFCG